MRCPLLWPDHAQRPRLVEIRDNLQARIAEAEREGWLGEVEGLQVGRTAANQKPDQLDQVADARASSSGAPNTCTVVAVTITAGRPTP